jgi:hypothetical protein
MLKYYRKVRELVKESKSEHLTNAILSKKVREKSFYLIKKRIE